MTFISIDPSLSDSGYAVWENGEVIEYGHIEALLSDVRFVYQIFLDNEIDVAVIETQFIQPGRVQGGMQTIQARATWEALARLEGLSIVEVPPSTWQSFCGLSKGLRGIKAPARRKRIKDGSIALAERAGIVTDNDNIADAVNIGRYYLYVEGTKTN